MKKTIFITLFLAILFTSSIGAWKFFRDGSIDVELIPVETGPIESIIRVTGQIINDRTVTMTALVNGQIQGMLVQKGDKVKAGQVLAYLDKREADALVQKAAAVVAREKQSVDETKRKLDRLKKISLTGDASDQAVEDAEALWHAALTRLQVAKAEKKVAQIHREKVEVTAPWDGVIIEKSAEQGQWLEAGIKLFTLVAEEGREIEANVDAGDSAVVKIGQTVTISTDALPGHSWTETIHWISPAIVTDDNAVLNSFAVRTTLNKDAPSLLLGQQVDIEIRTAQKESVMKLPYSVLIENEDTTKVAVVRDGIVKHIPVSTGIEDFTHVEIVSGIDASEKIIRYQGKAPTEGKSVNIVSTQHVP